MKNTVTLTVSQLNEFIKAMLDSTELLNDLYVKGEISNFTNHYKSGHFYFSLKDENGVLKAVMFRSNAVRLRFMPENGMKVLVRGRVSAYPRDGVYQLYAESIEPDGVGSLYLAYEQLKSKLSVEGLFDPEHKKPIPLYPKEIGIITADTGAAVADMKNILTRRFPCAAITIYPSLVQGASASSELCRAVRYFNYRHPVDTLIIGRGGGSIEDLWAFNSEALAHEIYNSTIPIISAVGHETDFTICDFVADLRAPTPSAAAELAVPDARDICLDLERRKSLLTRDTEALYVNRVSRLNEFRKSAVFSNPECFIERKRERLSEYAENINALMQEKVNDCRAQLALCAAKLDALSPLSVMARGFALVSDENGSLIKSVGMVKIGQKISVRFSDGSVCAVAESKEENKSYASQEET